MQLLKSILFTVTCNIPPSLTGRRGTQQKNTLQRYFATRGQDQSITSPLRNSIEQGFVDNQSTKENHWQLEREKMVGELATVRSDTFVRSAIWRIQYPCFAQRCYCHALAHQACKGNCPAACNWSLQHSLNCYSLLQTVPSWVQSWPSQQGGRAFIHAGSKDSSNLRAWKTSWGLQVSSSTSFQY